MCTHSYHIASRRFDFHIKPFSDSISFCTIASFFYVILIQLWFVMSYKTCQVSLLKQLELVTSVLRSLCYLYYCVFFLHRFSRSTVTILVSTEILREVSMLSLLSCVITVKTHYCFKML
jgi:hypothetical protein